MLAAMTVVDVEGALAWLDEHGRRCTGIRNEVGKGNDVFNQATQAATDLAAGLNQGQVTAEGTQQAATLLGKALNDPIQGLTALRRVGISFTKQQVDQI